MARTNSSRKELSGQARYKRTGLIGRGGMGTVYLAEDRNLGRRVAVKVLTQDLAQDEQAIQRFRREALSLANLAHPNVATLYDLVEDGELWMVMEYVGGPPLDMLLKGGKALPPEVAIPLFCQILDGVGKVHAAGICHRDIKPGNILLTEEGVPKVSDFGIAHVSGGDHITKAGHTIGTPAYMAPEQILNQTITPGTDIYSLGVTLYHMLGGRVPFQASSEFKMQQAHVSEPPPPFDSELGFPSRWSEITQRAMAKRPEDRYQTAAEFREALVAAIDPAVFANPPVGQYVAAVPKRVLGPVEPEAPAARPRRWVTAALATAIVTVCAAIVVAMAWKLELSAGPGGIDDQLPIARPSPPLPPPAEPAIPPQPEARLPEAEPAKPDAPSQQARPGPPLRPKASQPKPLSPEEEKRRRSLEALSQ